MRRRSSGGRVCRLGRGVGVGGAGVVAVGCVVAAVVIVVVVVASGSEVVLGLISRDSRLAAPQLLSGAIVVVVVFVRLAGPTSELVSQRLVPRAMMAVIVGPIETMSV